MAKKPTRKTTRKTTIKVRRPVTTKPAPKPHAAPIPEAKPTEVATLPPKKKPGRKPRLSPEEVARRANLRQRAYSQNNYKNIRDCRNEEWLELIRNINWQRRQECRLNLRLFCETYLPRLFYLGWSDDQLRCVRKAESVILEDGMLALAMPRGGGKTAIVRGALLWGSAYAHKRFPFNIGSTDDKAIQTLNAIKTFWYSSPLLLQDFPEIAYPIRRLENRGHGAKGQLFAGENTYIHWGANSIRLPCLLLPKEDADIYMSAWEGSDPKPDEPPPLHKLDEFGKWIPRQAGLFMATAGIGGAIRGEAETHPITLEQPRPDVVILDDIQKDQAAESPIQVEKLVNLIDGAVAGLAGPGQHISVFMPCTVTREGDVSDTYLDPLKKPEYRGERCRLVEQWPEGITDTQISLDTEAGKLWNKYGEISRQSYRDFERHSRLCEHCQLNLTKPCPEGIKLRDAATTFYRKHRRTMDRGFVVTWEARYGNPKQQPDGSIKRDDKELSAQQHAMNLRLKSPETFPAEYQNRGRKLNEEGEILITSRALAAKTIALPRYCIPVDAQYLSAFLDVQDEILFYCVLATAPDFTGAVVDYGTFPEITTRYFSKNQTLGWSLATRNFFDHYPEHRGTAIKTESGKVRAPFEAKIYHALSQAIPWLLDKQYIRQDEQQTPMKIQRLGVDIRWGQASDVIKRYLRESGFRDVIPYSGQAFPPTSKQLEEYQRTGQYKNWLFEDQKHPHIKDPKWVIRPSASDNLWYMSADVNRLKDFLFARLASPPGSPGSISLFEGTPDRHELFCDHICRSEYPEPVNARGLTKNQWKQREGAFNNDWLDCLTGCVALASWLGACLRTGGEVVTGMTRRKLSDRYQTKRR